MSLHIRRAEARDTDTMVRILIASEGNVVSGHNRRSRPGRAVLDNRWHGYITKGKPCRSNRWGTAGYFWPMLDGVPVGYVAYSPHQPGTALTPSSRTSTSSRRQGRGVGTSLLGVVAPARRRAARNPVCTGYDAASRTAFVISNTSRRNRAPGRRGQCWHHLGDLAARLPRPSEDLMTDLGGKSASWLRWLFVADLAARSGVEWRQQRRALGGCAGSPDVACADVDGQGFSSRQCRVPGRVSVRRLLVVTGCTGQRGAPAQRHSHQ